MKGHPLRAVRFAANVISIALLAGCAILPIPTRRHVPEALGTRGRVTEENLRGLTVGVTTRRLILLALGEPDRTWGAERYFYYRWTTVGGYWMWFLAGAYQGAAGVIPFGTREHDLILQFDDTGVLQRRASIAAWRLLEGPPGDSTDSESHELSVGHLDAGGQHRSRLTLGGTGLFFRDEGRRAHELRLAPDQIRSLRRQRYGQVAERGTWIGCTLGYALRPGHERRLRLVLEPEAMLALLDYLNRRCPQVLIEVG